MAQKTYRDALPEDEERLLESSPSLDQFPVGERPARARWTARLTYIALTVSLGLNAYLGFQQYRPPVASFISQFGSLRYNHRMPYEPNTEFSDHNRTATDARWDAVDTDPIVVALTDEYAQSQDLPVSTSRFPWDESRGIYHIKAYHQIHCLKNIYRAYTSKVDGTYTRIPDGHVYHCLDTLLQDIQCMADDTPMPTYTELHHIGNGQMRQCRDLDALAEWTRHPDQHACYRMLTDYGKVAHTLEEFAFCNDRSPYAATVDQYFAEHGHKDPFEGLKLAPGEGLRNGRN